jgi:hypothetical protein
MSGCLQLNSQKWELRGSDGLKLLLPRQRLASSIYFHVEWSFGPPTVDAATVPADEPRLRLRMIGAVPGLRDWRDLENLFLGYHEPPDGKELPDTRGPDIWIWPPGETKALRYGHWETDLKFGERHGHAFDFSLEGTIPSERASKFRQDYSVKQFFQQPVPADWELPEWVNEVEDSMSFAGRIELREIFCSSPINSAQPVEWARQLARRELAVEHFGPATLVDADHPAEKYQPNDGICTTGRLVVFAMPAD